jgi:hypothetical protein
VPLPHRIDARRLEWGEILCRYNMTIGKDKKKKRKKRRKGQFDERGYYTFL